VADQDQNWWLNDVGLVYPGDLITVEVSGGLFARRHLVPDPFAAYASSITNTVLGQVGGWTNAIVEVHGGWTEDYQRCKPTPPATTPRSFGAVPRGAGGYIRRVVAVDYAQVISIVPSVRRTWSSWRTMP